jgi:ribosomal subunit interface protein
MKIIIKAKNLDQSDALNAFIEKKFSSLKKFIDVLKTPEEKRTLAEVFVEVSKDTNHHKKGDIFLVKAMLGLPGRNIIAEATEEDLFVSVSKAKDALKLEIEKYKLKNIDKNRREQRKAKEDIEI